MSYSTIQYTYLGPYELSPHRTTNHLFIKIFKWCFINFDQVHAHIFPLNGKLDGFSVISKIHKLMEEPTMAIFVKWCNSYQEIKALAGLSWDRTSPAIVTRDIESGALSTWPQG